MTPPLPDSERSRRVYPLLQNQDLENVTQATLKSVGDPMSIENLNEDELRKLVLVNLARLSVKGEWNGLLTAAGGGSDGIILPGSVATYTNFCMADSPPWATAPNNSSDGDPTFTDDAFGYCFTAAKSGTLAMLGANFAAAASFVVGVYSTNDDGLPDTLVGKATLTATGSGQIEQTSITGPSSGSAGSLTQGDNYWVWYIRATSTSNGNINCNLNANRGRIFASDNVLNTKGGNVKSTNYDSSTGLPDTWSTTGMQPDNSYVARLWYEVS